MLVKGSTMQVCVQKQGQYGASDELFVPSVSKGGQSLRCCSMQSGHGEVWYNTLPAYCLRL